MGVYIDTLKIKRRICSLDDNAQKPLVVRSKQEGEDVIKIDEESGLESLIYPFNKGYYEYECGKHFLNMSYTSYSDFLDELTKIGEDNNDSSAFSVTIKSCGIDNCVSHLVAEQMLEEFEKYTEKAQKCFVTSDNDEYGEFLYGCYKTFIEVLRECVEFDGILRFS